MQRFHSLRLSVIAHDVLEGKRERVSLATIGYFALTRLIRRLKVFMHSNPVTLNYRWPNCPLPAPSFSA